MPLIVLIIFLFFIVFFVKYFLSLGIKKILILIFSFLIIFFSFNYPVKSVFILIFSMLLSPEIGVGKLPGRDIVIRYDDMLLVIMFLTWIFRTAVIKREAFIIKTPINLPLLIYTSIYFLSTFLGVIRGDILWNKAFFYVFKYFEYYFMYFMVVNILKEEKDFYSYIKAGWIVLLIVISYSYYYYFNASGEMIRTTAPFEAPLGRPQESEPASLGGYYLLCMGIIMSLISELRGPRLVVMILTFVFMYPSFLLTFSRASYMGFIALVFSFIFLCRKRKFFFIIVSFFVLMFSFYIGDIGGKVKDRIEYTYKGDEARNIVLTPFGIIKLEDSAYQRYQSIERVITKILPNYPILGVGVTGIGLGDNQYSLILGETGIVGFIVFIWLLYSIFRMSLYVYRFSDNPYERSLGLGVTCALFSFLVQGLGVNTFIIVRIMEPFWFCVALVSLSYMRIINKIKYARN